MSFVRKQVGATANYKGHEIVARHCGPDLLCYVDGVELSPFYLNMESAHSAGMRYVDQIEKEKEEKTNDRK